jgi:hypothetical protein
MAAKKKEAEANGETGEVTAHLADLTRLLRSYYLSVRCFRAVSLVVGPLSVIIVLFLRFQWKWS